MKKKIHLVAAARPNFMKIAPLYHMLKGEAWAEIMIVHTGQHYDVNMSDTFFRDLQLPTPHIHLRVGKGSHAEQTGRVMMAYEKVLKTNRPDLVVVAGDVNSTMACTIAAVKLGLKVAHLEAGLRSFDRTMPEEINRVITDSVADMLWTTSADGDENLLKEGISPEKIERVGNIMIDSIEMLRPAIEKCNRFSELGLKDKGYGLVTLHRPSNVDKQATLEKICNVLCEIAERVPLVFPIHPRSRKNLEHFHLLPLLQDCPHIFLMDPLNYITFMNLVFHCGLVITDSGGIQEETTYLGISCFTLRKNTERPVTVTQGTNELCTPHDLVERVRSIWAEKGKKTSVPDLWDGRTAKRVVGSMMRFMGIKSNS
jgi:UDP-N-acetylglucosamine 2-epimerase (non-hydrolysing)